MACFASSYLKACVVLEYWITFLHSGWLNSAVCCEVIAELGACCVLAYPYSWNSVDRLVLVLAVRGPGIQELPSVLVTSMVLLGKSLQDPFVQDLPFLMELNHAFSSDSESSWLEVQVEDFHTENMGCWSC